MPDQVRAVDALVALGDDGADAQELRPLGRPVARRARAVLLARQDDQRDALGLVALARRRRSSSPRRRAGGGYSPPRCPGASLLRSRMLANVPRTITSWLPRREPYELKSATSTPCSIRYVPAGLCTLIEPAGEMWSVVMLSPSTASTRAPLISRDRRRLGPACPTK